MLIHNNSYKLNKIITIVLTILIAFVMIYFVAYESDHWNHICTDADCPICHILQTAQTITKQLSFTGIIVFAAFLFIADGVTSFGCVFYSVITRNLILDKVRLDH